MAMAPPTTGQEHSADQLLAAKSFWRIHLTQAQRTAVVAGQMKHPLEQRVRNVQLLGLALQRGLYAPLERTHAVETLALGGHLVDLADSDTERDHSEVEDPASDVESTIEAPMTPSAASQTPQPRRRSRSSTPTTRLIAGAGATCPKPTSKPGRSWPTAKPSRKPDLQCARPTMKVAVERPLARAKALPRTAKAKTAAMAKPTAVLAKPSLKAGFVARRRR
jgi:hypothetical protein